jgi:hypothetical protein
MDKAAEGEAGGAHAASDEVKNAWSGLHCSICLKDLLFKHGGIYILTVKVNKHIYYVILCPNLLIKMYLCGVLNVY